MATTSAPMTTKEKARRLAAKGLSQSDAARELGVSRQRVNQIMVQLGLKFGPSVPPIPENRLRKLAKEGLTKTEAAQQMGVSVERVRAVAKKLGLTFATVWSRPKAPVTKLGAVMQKGRLASGYSYLKLAARSGLHEGHVRGIEQGMVRRPNEKTLRALARSLAAHTSYEELAKAAVPREETLLVQRMRKLADSGLTLSETSRRLKTSRDRVSVLASRNGIEFAAFRRQPKAPKTEFGRVIQAARLAKGYSYSNVAELSGLHRRHVMDLEVGRVRYPKDQTLRALAGCLGGDTWYKKLVRAVKAEAAQAGGGARGGRKRPKQRRAKKR